MSEIEIALDNPDINVKEYFKSFIKSKKIDELIAADNKLFTEVRNLESEKHVLVTQNYKKFVSATETINTIKSSLINFESELHNLKGKINNLVTNFNTINKPLEGKLKETEEIYKIKKDLKRLKFINDLPRILENQLNLYLKDTEKNLDILDKSLGYYEKCKEFLKIHKENNLVKDIYGRTKDLIYKYKTYINDEMNFAEFNEYEIEKFEKCLSLLVKVEDDKKDLIKIFIEKYQYLISCKFDKLFAMKEGVEELTFEMYNKIYDNYEFAINENDFLFYESEILKKEPNTNNQIPNEQILNNLNNIKFLNLSLLPSKYFKKGSFIWICKKICEEILSKFLLNCYKSYLKLFGEDTSNNTNTLFKLCINTFYQKIKFYLEKYRDQKNFLDSEFFRDGLFSFLKTFDNEIIKKIEDKQIEMNKFNEMIIENNKNLILQYINDIHQNFLKELTLNLQSRIDKLIKKDGYNKNSYFNDIDKIKGFHKFNKEIYINEIGDFLKYLTTLFIIYSRKIKSLGIENFNENKIFSDDTDNIYLNNLISLFGLFMMTVHSANKIKFKSVNCYNYIKYFINNDGKNNKKLFSFNDDLAKLKEIILKNIKENNEFIYFLFLFYNKLYEDNEVKSLCDKLFTMFPNLKKNRKLYQSLLQFIEEEIKKSYSILYDSIILIENKNIISELKVLFFKNNFIDVKNSPATFRLELKKLCFKLYQLRLDLLHLFESDSNIPKLLSEKKPLHPLNNNNKSNIQQEMEKLEIRRMTIYDSNIDSINTVLYRLTKIFMKTINEFIKIKKMSIYGFQQFKMDLCFIRSFFYNNIIANDNENIIDGFYNEILSNANFNMINDKQINDEITEDFIKDLLDLEQQQFDKIKTNLIY